MKKINLSFFILLTIFMQVILTDVIIYFLKLPYGISNIIASVINVGFIVFLTLKKIIKIQTNFSKWDLVFFTLLLIVIIATIYFPDIKYDSYSYHIYMQQKPFSDRINSDFMPGRTLTSFVFPIVDRIFYLARTFLGFRLGTLPSYMILIVMFYESKKIIKLLLNKDIKERTLSFIAIIPQTAFIVLEQLGSYYIDNFSVVILLEFVYIILSETNELFKNKFRLYYLAFIVGVGICIKITNGIYMILPLFYVLIKNIKDIKQIKWYDYIFLILTFIIPILPYLVNTVLQTRNPVFPYYNGIFKSPYYLEENWIDKRYGPKSIIELLIWPVYIIFFPRKAYEVGQTDIAFVVGYILSIIYIIFWLYKRIIKKQKISNLMITYCSILLCFYVVWAKFAIGYTRYAGVIAVLSTILIIKFTIDLLQKRKIMLSILPCIILCLMLVVGLYQFFRYGALYNYSLLIEGNLSINEKIKDNTSKIFKDRNNIKYDIEGIWGVIKDDSAVPLLLNVDDRIVHIESGFKTGESEKAKEIYWNNVLNNDIYVPLYNIKIDGKLDYFDKFHFEILEIADIIRNVSFLEKDDTIYIVKVKYNEQIEKGSGKNKEIFNELLKQY